MSDPLELAQVIESDLAHWRACQQRPCADCAFFEKLLALAGNMIFSDQTRDVHSLGEPPNPRPCSRGRASSTPAQIAVRLPGGLHAKLDLTQRARRALIHAQRVAATHFDDEAARATTAGEPEYADVFTRWAAEAREIADRFEYVKYVRVGRREV